MTGGREAAQIGGLAFERDPARWLASSDSYIPPRQERGRVALERIVAAAMRLFTARGFDATPVSEIAREAGVPVGTLYQRFPDKDAILRTILDGYRSFRLREINALCEAAQARAQDAAEIVALHVDIIFSAFRNDAGLLRLIEMRRLTNPEAHAQLVVANAEVADRIVTLLQQRLPQRDPMLLRRRVHYLHNIIRGSVVWATLPQVGDPAASLDLCDPGYADAAVAMALRYLDLEPVTPPSPVAT